MYTARRYGYWMTIKWSSNGFFFGLATALIALGVYAVIGARCFFVPWQPVLLVGTALAFYLGFKNNASYDRLWEARKIWGAIVNGSRSFAASVLGYVSNLHTETPIDDAALHAIKRRLIFRHLAWLTCLRYQMRTPRVWEHVELAEQFSSFLNTERNEPLNDVLLQYLSNEELAQLEGKSNKAVHVLALQTLDLQRLRQQGLIDDFRHVELQKFVSAMYDEQGKSERIKNFPFPRQYATIPLLFIKLVSVLLPFALIREFDAIGPHHIWLVLPFNGIVTWVFILMEMIGDYSENPFEGTYNDVPISAISRGIEIDLKEILHEQEIPAPHQPVNGMLM